MCGIAGSVSKENAVDLQVLNSLRHRGPDGQNYFQEDNVVLYHTRLAIVDTLGGSQPMKLGDELVIVFNGEIYNHQELREKYSLKCSTRSDTETLLHLFRLLGIDFLNELDGMFAFALYDLKHSKLWLARDRGGKKPLYYYSKNKELFFGSELNSFPPALKLEIEERHVYEYLRFGSFYRSHTPYKHVSELPAAHWMQVNLLTNDFIIKPWWSIKDQYLNKSRIDEESAIAELKHLLDLGVKRRLETSDLEVGCFLSGGIDSGLVASTASRFTTCLQTFTVAFPGTYNEAPLAKLVADKIGSHHTELAIDFSDLVDNIEQIITNFGEPFMDSSAIPTWYVSREAKKHVTVILNGDGADELFAGYRRYVPFAQYDFFNASAAVRSSARFINRLLPVSNEKKSVYNYLYRLSGLVKDKNADIYLSAGMDIFEGYEKEAFVDNNPRLFSTIENDINELLNGVESGLDKIMLLDFEINLFSDLLVKMDISTMSHALEGRSPFMSKEFLQWAPSLPNSLKIKHKTTKYILRQLAKQYLPSSLVNQPKRGFEIPLKNWVDMQLKDMIGDHILSPNSYFKQFVKSSFINNVWDRKLNVGEEKRAKILYTLFALEVWYKSKQQGAPHFTSASRN